MGFFNKLFGALSGTCTVGHELHERIGGAAVPSFGYKKTVFKLKAGVWVGESILPEFGRTLCQNGEGFGIVFNLHIYTVAIAASATAAHRALR